MREKLNSTDRNFTDENRSTSSDQQIDATSSFAAPGSAIILSNQTSSSVAAGTSPYTTVTITNGGMSFNLEFVNADHPTAAFETEIEQAASMLSAAITNKITVNLIIDYTGTGGSAGAKPDSGLYEPYSTIRADLQAAGTAGASSLPTGSTILGSSNVAVWNAQLKALGLMNPNDTTSDDGSCTFCTDIPQADMVGVAVHELTHALGRVPYGYGADIMEFYSFTSAGNRTLINFYQSDYFSLNGGVTKLAYYGYSSDPSDFLNSSAPNDPFDEYYSGSTIQHLSALDLQQLSALGYTLTSSSAMKVDYFTATESKTGDHYTGYVYDSQGKYSVGSTVTFNNDQAGGSWTYVVTSVTSTTASSSYNGKVYDSSYYDADKGTFTPYNYSLGSAAGTNFLGSDYDSVYVNGAYQTFGGGYYVVPDISSMKVDYFTATESKTGDRYYGYVYDNQGKYAVGSILTFNNDQAGGSWTYTVTSVNSSTASSSFNGKVYDYSYSDADKGTFTPYNYSLGSAAGTSFLGSDYDYVYVNGGYQEFGGGYYVVPDIRSMKVDYFTATESKTGDRYYGYVYDNQGKYSVGSTLTFNNDQAGGSWTYTVTSVNSSTASSSYNGKIYDYSYYDADKGTFTPYYYSNGYAEGSNFLGSDYDYVYVNGAYQEIGGGYYVVPDTSASMKIDYFTATESRTGDRYYGYVYDNQGKYSVGRTVTFSNDQAGGSWTYTITSVASSTANSSYNGYVYDYSYSDADRGTFTPYYYSHGYAEGSNFLGSDYDYVYVNGSYQLFGVGYYVVGGSSGFTENSGRAHRGVN